MTYRLLLIFFFPVIFIYTVKIAIRYRSLRYFLQRFGFSCPVSAEDIVWIHCASVGEVNTAMPLIKSFLKSNPDQQFMVTTTTPTGAKTVINNNLNNVMHCYLPVDIGFCVWRYLRQVKPCLAMIMETELWPELYRQCHKRGVPVTIINGRLSDRTLKASRWLKQQYKSALHVVGHVLARSEKDRQGFLELGCDPLKVEVSGNLKFANCADIQVTKPSEFTERQYILAASTHDDEEVQLARLWQNLDDGGRLLVIVPRHPERGREIAATIDKLGLDVALRSRNDSVTENTQIYIADTLGELTGFMAEAEMVFMGGSLVERGGQNILEPARLARPIIVGPYFYNFQQEIDLFVANKACIQVRDVGQLADVITDLLSNVELKNSLSSQALQLMDRESDIAGQYRKKITQYYKNCFL